MAAGSEMIALDVGTFFMVVFGVLNLIVVAVLTWIMKDLRGLAKDHRDLKDTVQTEYATKQELIRLESSISKDIHEIKSLIAIGMQDFKTSITRLHDRIDTSMARLNSRIDDGKDRS